MTGELAVSLVGSYKTLALAIAAWDTGTDTTPATDSHQLHVEEGQGNARYHLIKIVKTP